MDYLGSGSTAAGAAGATLAVTGGIESNPLIWAAAALLLMLGATMLIVARRRNKRDRALTGA